MNIFPETLQFSIPFIFVIILAFLSAILSYTVYKKTNPDNTATLRFILGFFRATLLLLLFILFFNPTLFFQFMRLQPKKIALLVDYSASMGLISNNENRIDSTINAVSSIENLLISKDASYDKAYFNEQLINSISDTAFAPLGLSDFGVLQKYVDDSGYDQIIIVSDGIRTKGEIPEFTNANVFTIGIGKTETEADVFIANVDYAPLVYQNEEQTVRVQISNKNARASARLNIYNSSTLLGSKIINIDNPNAEQEVEFSYSLNKTGVQPIKVEIIPQKNDSNSQNNIFMFTQKVVKNKIRVGIFSSVLNYEHKFIKFLLSQEKSINVYSYINIHGKKISSYPIDSLDVIIFQGYPAQNTSSDELNMLKRVLNFNKPGLITFLDRFTSANALTGFSSYLPVSGFIPINSSNPYSIIPVASNTINPVVRLYDDANLNASFWNSVPPVTPAFGLQGFKDGAEPILEYQGSRGIKNAAVLYESANIKSIILNGQGFWKWHFSLIDKNDYNDGYKRFLINMVKWSANKSKFKPVVLNPNKDTVHPGQEIIFQTQIFDAQNQIIKNGQVTIKAVLDKQEFTIAAVQDSNGNHSARYTPSIEGSYTFTAYGFSNGQEMGKDTRRIEVIPYSREFISTRQDTSFLKTLADKNSGKYFSAKNLANLGDYVDVGYNKILIDNEIELRLKTWFLVLILGLAVFEWVLRKKNNLV